MDGKKESEGRDKGREEGRGREGGREGEGGREEGRRTEIEQQQRAGYKSKFRMRRFRRN